MTLLIVIIVAVLLYVVLVYNGMVKLRNRVKEAWSDIDVQLKRRYNLIPNLVESVKGYASHEEGVFTKVTEARANAINAGTIKDQGVAENMLSGALKSLFAVAENYPDLKANENFLQLQGELADTEDKIQASRRFYNGNTRDYNTKIQQFPAKLIAEAFKFKQEEFFEIEDEEQRENVEVSFDKTAPAEATPPAQPAPEPEPEPTPEPAEPEAPAEPATCPKCGGEMTEGHTCPVAEETPATPEPEAESPAEESPAPAEPTPETTPEPAEPEAPAEPATCPKCGGEMTEGHTCPVAEETPAKEETPAPAEPETPAEAEPESPPAEPTEEEKQN